MNNMLEMLWGVKLSRTKFCSHKIGGTFTDFEKAMGMPSKSMCFRNWLKNLINEGIVEEFEIQKTRGGTFATYIVNRSKLDIFLRSNPNFDMFYEYFMAYATLPPLFKPKPKV